MNTKPRWRTGPPNKPGLWLVITSTGDLAAWACYMDRDDRDDGTRSKPYLRFEDEGNTAPVEQEHSNFPVRKSFGPIRTPRN